MKRVLKDEDLKVKIEIYDKDGFLVNYQMFEEYKITAYTTSLENGAVYDRSNIDDYVLNIQAQDLEKLKNGIILLNYSIKTKDNSYIDGNFCKCGTLQTRYYLYLGKDNDEIPNCHCEC